MAFFSFVERVRYQKKNLFSFVYFFCDVTFYGLGFTYLFIHDFCYHYFITHLAYYLALLLLYLNFWL